MGRTPLLTTNDSHQRGDGYWWPANVTTCHYVCLLATTFYYCLLRYLPCFNFLCDRCLLLIDICYYVSTTCLPLF